MPFDLPFPEPSPTPGSGGAGILTFLKEGSPLEPSHRHLRRACEKGPWSRSARSTWSSRKETCCPTILTKAWRREGRAGMPQPPARPTGAHSWLRSLGQRRPDSQSLPPAARRGQAYGAGRPPAGILTITAAAPSPAGLAKPLLGSSHVLPTGTRPLASILQRGEPEAERGWVTCPGSRGSLQASLSTGPLHQLPPCRSALLCS